MKRLLMNPGPTNVNPAVRQAMLSPDLSHREQEFADVLKSVCQKWTSVVHGVDAYDTVPFVASGTGVNEAMLGVTKGPVLVLVAGRYSQRLYDIAKRLNVDVSKIEFEPFEGIDMRRLREAVAQAPKKYDYFCLVHHETTTGILAPLQEIGALAKEYGAHVLVDGVSSVGGHDVDVERDNIAMCTVNANKCLESLPGISFLISRKSLLAASKGHSRSFYFDLYEQWHRCSTSGKLPFTAAVPMFLAADVALDRLLSETVNGRANRYRMLKGKLEGGLEQLGWKLLPIPESRKSNILTSAYLPVGVSYQRLRELMGKRGITIYTDDATVRKGIVFFATLGDIGTEDIDRFLSGLAESLRETGAAEVA